MFHPQCVPAFGQSWGCGRGCYCALRCTVWLYYVYDPDLSAIAEQATICTCGAQHDLCVRMRAYVCVRVRA